MEGIRAGEDFDAARFRAFRRAVLAVLTRRRRDLVSLDDVVRAAGSEGRAHAGVHEIPLDLIAGSAAAVAKGGDFDPAFLPSDRRLRDRWTRIYRAMVEGGELPPIDVYRVGEHYYVIDGHHRVSVARSLGRETINADVVEIRTRAPLGPAIDADALLRAAEYAAFLDETGLHRLRPEARLECSRLGRYDEILAHLHGHRYFLSVERGHEVDATEATASWYDNVFLPTAQLVREHGVLDGARGWTEADAYVEITRRWLEMSKAGKEGGPHPALHAMLEELARSRTRRRRLLRLGR